MKSLRLLVVLPLLAAVACGNGSPDEAKEKSAPATDRASVSATPDEAPAPDVDALRQAAQGYSDAFLTGDSDAAYALLSERCQQRMGAEEFGAMVVAAASAYGKALPFATYEADEQATMARVTYTYASAPEIDQRQEPWVNEGGWRQDDC